jgi:hypothetical protein
MNKSTLVKRREAKRQTIIYKQKRKNTIHSKLWETEWGSKKQIGI